VGYALAEEIAANRPFKPGPEWWLLLDLALDADDTTRRTMCGFDYMTERTQAPRSTVFRWLKKLHDDGLITTVEKAAGSSAGKKGKRAVYEIQVPPRLTARIAGHLGLVSPAVGPESPSLVPRGGTTLDQSGMASLVSPAVGPESAGNASLVSPAMGPPLQHPIGPAPMEGARERSDQDRIDKDKITPRRVGARSAQTPGRRGRPSTPEDLKPDSSVQVRGGVSSPADVDVTRAREETGSSDTAAEPVEPARRRSA